MQAAKVLAFAVVPNEYGIEDQQKLRIGGKICASLLAKLLADLANMREESLATAVSVSVKTQHKSAACAICQRPFLSSDQPLPKCLHGHHSQS